MSKRGVIRCIFSCVMIVYIIVALYFTSAMAAADKCKSIKIEINDPDTCGFVTVADIDRSLGSLSIDIKNYRRDSINLRDIERRLRSFDNVESANCVLCSDGRVLVEVTPLVPVVRVFDRNGMDYYINHAGKRMDAHPQYRIDVPVVQGEFSEALKPTIIVPYIDFLRRNPEIDSLVSSFVVKPGGDIIMVPKIRGHVVNMGDTADIANKFDRLRAFYAQVLPVKGAMYYDTISVKWRSRVIASKRGFKRAAPVVVVEEHEDFDDLGTMSDGTTPPERTSSTTENKKP